MRLDEIVSVSNWISRKLGNRWEKIGDVVKGTTVSDYLDRDGLRPHDEDYEESKYKLIEIDLPTARNLRQTTDEPWQPFGVLDSEKLARVREYNITYDSLLKNPPVITKDGFVLDGNHRLERAIELKLPKIPVLLQIK